MRRTRTAADCTPANPSPSRGTAALREADRTVAAESVATLPRRESQRFLAALGKPFAPNAALRRAMKRGDALGI